MPGRIVRTPAIRSLAKTIQKARSLKGSTNEVNIVSSDLCGMADNTCKLLQSDTIQTTSFNDWPLL